VNVKKKKKKTIKIASTNYKIININLLIIWILMSLLFRKTNDIK